MCKDIQVGYNDLAAPYNWAYEDAYSKTGNHATAIKEAMSKIDTLRRWAFGAKEWVRNDLGDGLKACHHPLSVISYLGLYIDERVQWLFKKFWEVGRAIA